MKSCPIMSQNCQNRLSILPNRKWKVNILPKIFNVLPNWRIFWSHWPWSYLVRRDERLVLHNSQACMEWCHAFAAYFFCFVINTTAYHWVWYSLHLQLKSSMLKPILRMTLVKMLFNNTSLECKQLEWSICYNRYGRADPSAQKRFKVLRLIERPQKLTKRPQELVVRPQRSLPYP